MNGRLADFIRAEMEPILQDWEEFAKTILHARYLGKVELRDRAKDMLLEIADDLDLYQSESEQAAKSKGWEPEDEEESSAEVHGGTAPTMTLPRLLLMHSRRPSTLRNSLSRFPSALASHSTPRTHPLLSLCWKPRIRPCTCIKPKNQVPT